MDRCTCMYVRSKIAHRKPSEKIIAVSPSRPELTSLTVVPLRLRWQPTNDWDVCLLGKGQVIVLYRIVKIVILFRQTFARFGCPSGTLMAPFLFCVSLHYSTFKSGQWNVATNRRQTEILSWNVRIIGTPDVFGRVGDCSPAFTRLYIALYC